ncbi:MAG: GNAT family N-acetyltransferase [Roseiflexus sp.]
MVHCAIVHNRQLVACGPQPLAGRPQHIYVSRVYVAGARRGQGLARALMARLLSDDIARGARWSVLTTSRMGERLYAERGRRRQRRGRRWMTDHVTLRPIADGDLPILFDQQRAQAAVWMAAFTDKDPSDWEAFRAHETKVLADPNVTNRTILADVQVASSIACHAWCGEPEVIYGLGQEFWSRDIATRALALCLAEVPARSIHVCIVKNNVVFQRVLERNGFSIYGEDRGLAEGRGAEVEEWLLVRHAQ